MVHCFPRKPRGVQLGVLVTASNKGVLLALIAMAQTLPVLTGGIDLSVGAIVVLTNCLASNLVDGNPRQGGAGRDCGVGLRPGGWLR
jgi:ribose transport system permease protein